MLIKVRKIIKRADKDNYFTPNNEIFTFIGTIIMWFSICHLQSGYNLHVYDQRYEAEMAYINCLVAGAAGGLSAFLMKKLIHKQKLQEIPYNYSTYILNPLSNYDIVAICRGIIAGCVIISAPGVYYKVWISFILGLIAGIVYVGSSIILHKVQIDEPMHIF